MKFYKQIGIAACIVLLLSCFLPWTYHADIHKSFTGFFSEKNIYGKPGKFISFYALISMVLILTPKIWAKRAHLFFAAWMFGYAIKSYILFSSCYNAYCPEKRIGIYLMIYCCLLILILSIFPDLKINNTKPSNTTSS